jgi:putative hemin transport protein
MSVDAGRFEELVRAFEPLGNVHVIVTNAACTLESFGTFGNFSTFGEYFNVQSKTIDMHVRPAQIGAIFAVEKPGHMDGVNTLSPPTASARPPAWARSSWPPAPRASASPSPAAAS